MDYILCKECPRCEDKYPGKLDSFGNHFCICNLSGNMVYPEPRTEKKMSGHGIVHFKADTCGLYPSVDDALASMRPFERQRYLDRIAGASV